MQKFFGIIAFLGIIMLSCSKTTDLIPNPVSGKNSEVVVTSSSESSKVIIGIWVSWSEWGRARRNCEGWGLCNYNWGWTYGGEKSAPVYAEPNGKMYVNILIDAIPEGENVQFLIIDEDLTSTGANGDTYLIKKGEYPLNSSLGSLGGYKVGIQKK